jgi:hypothetical protein
MQKSRTWLLLALVAVASLFVAACGSSGNDSSSSEETSSTSASTEAKTSIELPSETAPTEIPKLEPLPKAPPKGVNAAVLQCDFSICKAYADSFKRAGAKLGWNVKSIVFKTGQPQAALETALHLPGIEYVAISGTPREIIEPQVKEAEAKGIVLLSAGDPTPPHAPVWPVEISDKRGNSENAGTAVASWIIHDSGETAHIGGVGLPEIPTTALQTVTQKKVTEENCPECTYTEIPLTGEELAAGSGISV